VSKHWRASGKIVRIRPLRRGRWTRPGEYLEVDAAAPARVVPVVLGAVVLGIIAAGVVGWTGRSVHLAKSDAPIEWNAVQAVPRRTPDADDIAWAKRAEEPLTPPVEQSVQAPKAGLPRASGARNDGIYVIDGDTFAFGGQRIRIAGIDAPEIHPPRCMDEARLGLAASQKLRQLLGSGTVAVSGTMHDKYGREVREVRVNGQDVGEAMVSAGLARSYDGKKRQGWC
jgi:hypothetical protein